MTALVALLVLPAIVANVWAARYVLAWAKLARRVIQRSRETVTTRRYHGDELVSTTRRAGIVRALRDSRHPSHGWVTP